MIATYNNTSEQNEDTVKAIEQQITDLNKKLERLEEGYVLEEINKEMYDKYHLKFTKKNRQIEQEMEIRKQGVEPCRMHRMVFVISEKLATAWASSDWRQADVTISCVS